MTVKCPLMCEVRQGAGKNPKAQEETAAMMEEKMDTKKYIIEIPDNTAWLQWVKVSDKDGHVCFDFKDPEDLTPYTEPDLDAIRNEAYEKGVQDTKQHLVDAPRTYAYKLGYENGLNDAWEAAKKIVLSKEDGGLFGYEARKAVFGCGNYMALKKYTVSEVIEKIRQYEQEKEEGKKADFGKVRDVLRTTAKECHVTFDEIAEVLSGIMGEKTDGQE